MKNILILGASGSLPKVVIPVLLQNPEIKLTLFARHTHELMPLADNRVTIVQGDATSLTQLEKILPGHRLRQLSRTT
nr:NAD(P)H-binding protein [Snodgrassella gandavensis]